MRVKGGTTTHARRKKVLKRAKVTSVQNIHYTKQLMNK